MVKMTTTKPKTTNPRHKMTTSKEKTYNKLQERVKAGSQPGNKEAQQNLHTATS